MPMGHAHTHKPYSLKLAPIVPALQTRFKEEKQILQRQDTRQRHTQTTQNFAISSPHWNDVQLPLAVPSRRHGSTTREKENGGEPRGHAGHTSRGKCWRARPMGRDGGRNLGQFSQDSSVTGAWCFWLSRSLRDRRRVSSVLC